MRKKLTNDNGHWKKGIELCNRTACQSPRNVIMYNKNMNAFYCVRCARLINDSAIQSNMEPLCKLSEEKLQYEKTDKSFTWDEYKEQHGQ